MRTLVTLALIVLLGCGRDTAPAQPPITSPAAAGLVEDMVAIPGGEFLGRPIHCVPGVIPSPPPRESLENRVKQVIGPYLIDRRVASCADYGRCRSAGACSVPRSLCRHDVIGGDVHVSLTGATEYCAWRGAHVIRYAEWQRAVRGVEGRYRPDGSETWTLGDYDDAMKSESRFTTPDGVEEDLREGDEWTSDAECDDEGRLGPLMIDLFFLLSSIVVPEPDIEAAGRVATGRVRCARELTH